MLWSIPESGDRARDRPRFAEGRRYLAVWAMAWRLAVIVPFCAVFGRAIAQTGIRRDRHDAVTI